MSHKFHRVYIEVTNVCGLQCSFCPPKTATSKTMTLDFFNQIVSEVSSFTDEISLHVMGDPLALSNLNEYLDIAQTNGLKVALTTSGLYLKNHPNIFHESIKQINVSLNSYNKNSMKCTFEEYMSEVLKFCKRRSSDEVFINLRLWNLDKFKSAQSYNEKIFDTLSDFFNIELNKHLLLNPPKSLRVAKKILLHFDNYFEWPNLSSTHETDGFCHGLSGQLAILSNGRVVPCCLDSNGIIDLGNLHVDNLHTILNSKKAKNIIKGFQNSKAVEELCKKCTFKERFNPKQ